MHLLPPSGCAGAIYSENEVAVTGTLFEDTKAGRTGGAISCWSDRAGNVDITVRASTFLRADSGERGGAVFSLGSQVVVDQCTFEETHSGLLGGALYGAQAVMVTNSVFNRTTSDIDGGAVFGTEAVLVRSSFRATTAAQVRAHCAAASRFSYTQNAGCTIALRS